jgi:hypothetical protein
MLEVTPGERYRDDVNSCTYAMSGHTHKTPRTLRFLRQEPTVTSTSNGVAGFVCKFTRGDTDADGIPRREMTLLELRVRMPRDNDASHIDDGLTLLSAILSDPTIIANLRNGILPTASTI